jgi:hypothetical protein
MCNRRDITDLNLITLCAPLLCLATIRDEPGLDLTVRECAKALDVYQPIIAGQFAIVLSWQTVCAGR